MGRISGVAVMVLGFIMIGMGLYTVVGFPWSRLELAREFGETYEPSPWMPDYNPFQPLLDLLTWTARTLIPLIAALFISGAGLLVAGYAIYKTPT